MKLMPDMQMPDKNQKSLTDNITELESLISGTGADEDSIPVLYDTAGAGNDFDDGIPILDEPVYADEEDAAAQLTDLPSGTADQVLDLIDNIEQRLTSELEDLVKTLKTTMKESIIEELKTRLDEYSGDPAGQSRPPEHDQ